MKTIFITGATGNIGSRILSELAKDGFKIKVLVRGPNPNKKMQSIFSFWSITQTENIEVIEGDITYNNLGIDTGLRKRLQKEVTHIIHCAASVKLNMALEEARHIILDGTKNVVHFALGCEKFCKLSYMSTMEVAGNMKGTVYENYITQDRGFLNTYEQAKAEVEDFLSKQDLNVSIYRPSMVVGDSSTGKLLHFQSFYRLIDNYYLNPPSMFLPGTKNFKIDTIPVDVIARFLRQAFDDKESRIYNMISGEEAVALPQFLDLLLQTAKKVDGKVKKKTFLVTPYLFYFFINAFYPFTFGKIKHSLYIQKIFIEFFFLKVSFDNSKFIHRLNQEGMSSPVLSDYLESLYRYYLYGTN